MASKQTTILLTKLPLRYSFTCGLLSNLKTLVVIYCTTATILCRTHVKPDSTRWSTVGEVKGSGVEWVASSVAIYLRTCSITITDAHTSAASSRLNWPPSTTHPPNHQFKWTRPFRWWTKYGFCACAITFQLVSKTSVIISDLIT